MSYIGTTEIGKMFLGDVEIGKAYLGNDLVFSTDGATPVNPGDLSNYVQDGLVLHLDGINKGGASGRWSSLVGTEYYTLTAHSTSETNSILMDGSGAIEATNPVDVNGTSGTIEVCAQYLGNISNLYTVTYGRSGKLMMFVRPSSGTLPGYAFSTGTNANILWGMNPVTLYTVSANSSRCMVNGTVQGTLTNTTMSSNLTTNKIGGRPPYANAYYGNVRIYSIRKYNRILTEAEMLQNQKVDNARFNLGLNI